MATEDVDPTDGVDPTEPSAGDGHDADDESGQEHLRDRVGDLTIGAQATAAAAGSMTPAGQRLVQSAFDAAGIPGGAVPVVAGAAALVLAAAAVAAFRSAFRRRAR